MQWDLGHCLKLLLFYTLYEFYLLHVLRDFGIAFYKVLFHGFLDFLQSVILYYF